MCENFDFVYDWTTKNDLKKRENSNDVYMILDEKDQNDEELVGGGNNKNINKTKTKRNENDDDLEVEDVDNDDNNENKNTNKENEDKVESTCCLM